MTPNPLTYLGEGGGIAVVIALTAALLYGLLLETNVDAFWLLKIHTGNFWIINLQPYYSAIIGVLTLIIAISGLGLLLGGRSKAPQAPS